MSRELTEWPIKGWTPRECNGIRSYVSKHAPVVIFEDGDEWVALYHVDYIWKGAGRYPNELEAASAALRAVR